MRRSLTNQLRQLRDLVLSPESRTKDQQHNVKSIPGGSNVQSPTTRDVVAMSLMQRLLEERKSKSKDEKENEKNEPELPEHVQELMGELYATVDDDDETISGSDRVGRAHQWDDLYSLTKRAETDYKEHKATCDLSTGMIYNAALVCVSYVELWVSVKEKLENGHRGLDSGSSWVRESLCAEIGRARRLGPLAEVLARTVAKRMAKFLVDDYPEKLSSLSRMAWKDMLRC